MVQSKQSQEQPVFNMSYVNSNIPVTENAGTIFADFSGEVRSGMTDVNGSLGYRFAFFIEILQLLV